jgi:phospholipase/lecithinase/hemolysin
LNRIYKIGLFVILLLMSINIISPEMTAIQSSPFSRLNNLNRFNQVYIFGDSLSDPGNLFSITEGTFPSNPPYPQQRFSNGFVWSEYFTSKFGLNPTPFTHPSPSRDGINFAVGGATTGETNVNGESLPSLQQQLNAFIVSLQQTHQQANPEALYILWAGANDYLGGQITDPADPVANLSQAIESLYQVGARSILVLNLPELGDTPLAQNSEDTNPSQLNQLSNAHNTLLKTAVQQLSQSLPEIQLGLVDIRGLFKMVIADPKQFGLSNVTDGCVIVACSDPDQYLFWDQLHPTTTAHQIIADAVFSALQLKSQSEHKLTMFEPLRSNQLRA